MHFVFALAALAGTAVSAPALAHPGEHGAATGLSHILGSADHALAGLTLVALAVLAVAGVRSRLGRRP